MDKSPNFAPDKTTSRNEAARNIRITKRITNRWNAVEKRKD